MYHSNTDFFEIATIVTGIFNFIVAIVFFVMAANIGGIRRFLAKRTLSYNEIATQLEYERFIGNKQKIVDLLHQKAYLTMHDNNLDKYTRYQNMESIAMAIASYEGIISPGLKTFLEKNAPKK